MESFLIMLSMYKPDTNIKAELPKVSIFFALNFLPWEFLLLKKLEIENN